MADRDTEIASSSLSASISDALQFATPEQRKVTEEFLISSLSPLYQVTETLEAELAEAGKAGGDQSELTARFYEVANRFGENLQRAVHNLLRNVLTRASPLDDDDEANAIFALEEAIFGDVLIRASGTRDWKADVYPLLENGNAIRKISRKFSVPEDRLIEIAITHILSVPVYRFESPHTGELVESVACGVAALYGISQLATDKKESAPALALLSLLKSAEQARADRYIELLEKLDGLNNCIIKHQDDELSEVQKGTHPIVVSAVESDKSRAAKAAVSIRHKKLLPARLWVVAEWKRIGADAAYYNGNKSAFARKYSRLIVDTFNEKIEERTIRESWLKGL
jgi:hypothetical protein